MRTKPFNTLELLEEVIKAHAERVEKVKNSVPKEDKPPEDLEETQTAKPAQTVKERRR